MIGACYVHVCGFIARWSNNFRYRIDPLALRLRVGCAPVSAVLGLEACLAPHGGHLQASAAVSHRCCFGHFDYMLTILKLGYRPFAASQFVASDQPRGSRGPPQDFFARHVRIWVIGRSPPQPAATVTAATSRSFGWRSGSMAHSLAWTTGLCLAALIWYAQIWKLVYALHA